MAVTRRSRNTVTYWMSKRRRAASRIWKGSFGLAHGPVAKIAPRVASPYLRGALFRRVGASDRSVDRASLSVFTTHARPGSLAFGPAYGRRAVRSFDVTLVAWKMCNRVLNVCVRRLG